MSKNPRTLTDQKNLIIKAICRDLREKSLNGDLNAQGELDSVSRDFAVMDKVCDTTANQVSNPIRKTKV